MDFQIETYYFLKPNDQLTSGGLVAKAFRKVEKVVNSNIV
jgi:hypothetical protein